MLYPLILSGLALLFLVAETLFPWRPAQRRLRKHFATDAFYFAFNGYVLGLISFWLVWRLLWPALYPGLEYLGLNLRGYHGPAASWPLWVQIIAAVLTIDLTLWLIHNLLHRSSWLWELHKVHHSIQD
jgi:sterol desaturase/sphingolipid hydroxylase (fatty acid hydroxylase superfamily)